MYRHTSKEVVRKSELYGTSLWSITTICWQRPRGNGSEAPYLYYYYLSNFRDRYSWVYKKISQNEVYRRKNFLTRVDGFFFFFYNRLRWFLETSVFCNLTEGLSWITTVVYSKNCVFCKSSNFFLVFDHLYSSQKQTFRKCNHPESE